MGNLIGLTNSENCNRLLQAIQGADYKATRRYVTYVLHHSMDIKKNGADVKIVQKISSGNAEVANVAMKFFRHFANAWCAKWREERWHRTECVRRLNSYISTKAVVEIIRLLASENQSCREFSEDFLKSFLHFFVADEEISSALKEVGACGDGNVRCVAAELYARISKSNKSF